MATTINVDGQQQAQQQRSLGFSKDLSMHTISSRTVKSTGTSLTGPTVVESSEEFTLSGEMTTSSCLEQEGPCALQLSNLVILEENHHHQQRRKVRFAADVTIVEDKDIAVPLRKKKNKKDKKKESDQDRLEQILPQDIWWSPEELEAIEMNASYMVKESQQYQEEVICTVLYNKAFLSAANLGKSFSEDEMAEKLQDVTQYSNTLEKWTAVGHSRRGLENMVSEKAVVDAIQSRMQVLHFQKELKEAGAADSSDDGPPSIAQHAELLAKRCQDTSRTARIMARMMGQADADSLATAETLCAETPSLPEPPGRYSGDHEYINTSERISRRNRRGSLLKTVKKTVGNVFRRQGSREANMKRIRKIQQRRQAEEEPPKRPSQEFRRSFLESLDYGEQ